MEESNFVD
jgi:hypothetical protein